MINVNVICDVQFFFSNKYIVKDKIFQGTDIFETVLILKKY